MESPERRHKTKLQIANEIDLFEKKIARLDKANLNRPEEIEFKARHYPKLTSRPSSRAIKRVCTWLEPSPMVHTRLSRK